MSIVGVVSDSHDHMENIRRAVRVFEEAGCGLVVHAGDVISPFALKAFLEGRFELAAVYGNNDGERAGLARLLPGICEGPLGVETPGGKRVLVAHERWRLPEDGGGADLMVFGHTHEAGLEEVGGVLALNPGEACGYLTGRATVALWDDKTGEARIIEL